MMNPMPVLLAIAALTAAPPPGGGATDTGVYVIDAGKIVTMDDQDRVLNNARAVVADGKLVAVFGVLAVG